MTATITVTLTPLPTATVIDSYYDSLALTAYPNPVKTGSPIYMLYNYQDARLLTVRLYSLDGTQALSVNYNVSGKGRLETDTSQLAPGVYYYTVEAVHSGTTEKTKVKKLVVSR